MKSTSFFLLLFIPGFLFCQIEFSDKQTQILNTLINDGNNKHLKEYCEFLSSADKIQMDEKSLYLQTKNYSSKIIEARSYNPKEITEKELFYKLTFDAFKLCPTSNDILKHVFSIPDHVANFITIFEQGDIRKEQFINESDYLRMLEIQKDANLISKEVLVNLNLLVNKTKNKWTYSYYKFYPQGRKEDENLFSSDNKISTLTFSMIDNKIAVFNWDDETKLFPILKRNLSRQVNPPPPPPRN